jgi:DNA repair photolyase
MIPAINDVELERILEAAAGAGARYASYVLLRLPLEVRDLFVQWLQAHYPLRANHVMHRVQDMRGGKDYEARFATRMKGRGLFADLLKQRFAVALRRTGLQKLPGSWDVSQFQRPTVTMAKEAEATQSSLF